MDCVTLLRQDIEKWNRWRVEQASKLISLAGEDLSCGYFFGANFSGVDLRGANLRRACLIGADFSHADLRGANLTAAYLGDANFWGANITQANLAEAHLTRVDLTQAIGTPSNTEHVVTEHVVASELTPAVTPTQQSTEAPTPKRTEQLLAEQPQQGHKQLSENDPAVKIAMAKLLQRPTAHRQRLWSMMPTR